MQRPTSGRDVRVIAAAILALSVGVGAAACSSDDDNPSDDGDTPAGTIGQPAPVESLTTQATSDT